MMTINLDECPQNLQVALLDLVERVEIKPNLTIYHPDYGTIALTPAALDRFQQVTLDLQQQYLCVQLQNLIYSTYYNGITAKQIVPSAETAVLTNNTLMGIDIEFNDRLDRSNQGHGYFDPDWRIIGWADDRQMLLVKKGELTLHIDPEYHLHPESKAALLAIDELIPNRYTVPVLMPKNRVQNGFYVAISDGGSQVEEIVRIYFNLDPDGAVLTMSEVTDRLNQSQILFSFKVLSTPSDYVRHDAGVLYFQKSDYPLVAEVMRSIYPIIRSHLKPSIPLFAKQLVPGLGLAEEPAVQVAKGESFGQHRCRLIAQGLLQAEQELNSSPSRRMECIFQQFIDVGLDLRYPYLNAGGQDIYQLIIDN
jgi:hypothetical protein